MTDKLCYWKFTRCWKLSLNKPHSCHQWFCPTLRDLNMPTVRRQFWNITMGNNAFCCTHYYNFIHNSICCSKIVHKLLHSSIQFFAQLQWPASILSFQRFNNNRFPSSSILTLLVFLLGNLFIKYPDLSLLAVDSFIEIPQTTVCTCSTILCGIFPYFCPLLRSIRTVLHTLMWFVRWHIYSPTYRHLRSFNISLW